MIEGTVYHVEGRDELDGTESIVVTEISEIAYQKEQEAIIQRKAEQEEVDAIAAAIERGACVMNKKMLDALTSAIYVSRLSLAGEAVTEDDQKIRAAGLYPDWEAGKHTKGEIYNTHAGDSLGNEWEQTWECYQAYDNATYPGLIPGDSSWYTFNRPLHGKTKETARPFVPVQGAHDMYHTGEYMIFTDGKVYRCKQDTNFSPTDYAQAWEVEE